MSDQVVILSHSPKSKTALVDFLNSYTVDSITYKKMLFLFYGNFSVSFDNVSPDYTCVNFPRYLQDDLVIVDLCLLTM